MDRTDPATPTDLAVRQHLVIFYGPGTFFPEQESCPVNSWDVEQAKRLAGKIVLRYGARPYGFCFVTRGRTSQELDSKELARSGMYFLGGKVETAEEILARDDPKEETLRWNLRHNNEIKRVVVNTNSYLATLPLYEGDVVLEDYVMPPLPKKGLSTEKEQNQQGCT